MKKTRSNFSAFISDNEKTQNYNQKTANSGKKKKQSRKKFYYLSCDEYLVQTTNGAVTLRVFHTSDARKNAQCDKIID